MQTVLLLYTRYIMQNGNNRGYGAGGGYFCSIVICDCVCVSVYVCDHCLLLLLLLIHLQNDDFLALVKIMNVPEWLDHIYIINTGSTTLFPPFRKQDKAGNKIKHNPKETQTEQEICIACKCVCVFVCHCVCVQMITTGTCGKSGFGVLLARRVAATVVAFALAQGARIVRHHAHLTGQTADVAALAAIF